MSQLVVMPNLNPFSSFSEIFLMATEDLSNNDMVLLYTPQGDKNIWQEGIRFTAAAGATALNIMGSPNNPDLLLCYGLLDNNQTIGVYTISTGAYVDISPAGTPGICNALQIRPGTPGELIATFADGTIKRTTDGGQSYTDLPAQPGTSYTALIVFWKGQYYPHSLFVGHKGTNLELNYSPNQGATFSNLAGANLGAAGQITAFDRSGLEVVIQGSRGIIP